MVRVFLGPVVKLLISTVPFLSEAPSFSLLSTLFSPDHLLLLSLLILMCPMTQSNNQNLKRLVIRVYFLFIYLLNLMIVTLAIFVMTSLSGICHRNGGLLRHLKVHLNVLQTPLNPALSYSLPSVVTLVCCIFFVYRTNCLSFVSVLFPLICVLLLTVNVHKAKLLFFRQIHIFKHYV